MPIRNRVNHNGYNKPIGKLIDFHSHILPNMDDGSRSVDESLQMIDASVRQGVCCIVLTPHFYAYRDNPESFLKRRNLSFRSIREKITTPFPILLTGAEVQYFNGITSMDEISELYIEKTDLLLLEMPFQKWSSHIIDDVLELNSRNDCKVIIAHIERYISEQPRGVLEELLKNRVLIQSNAGFFIDRFSRRKALHWLNQGHIHFLGSDCHNMTSRPPQLGECFEIIQEKSGVDVADKIIENGFEFLLCDNNREISKSFII